MLVLDGIAVGEANAVLGLAPGAPLCEALNDFLSDADAVVLLTAVARDDELLKEGLVLHQLLGLLPWIAANPSACRVSLGRVARCYAIPGVSVAGLESFLQFLFGLIYQSILPLPYRDDGLQLFVFSNDAVCMGAAILIAL